jgi:hypothetical protein
MIKCYSVGDRLRNIGSYRIARELVLCRLLVWDGRSDRIAGRLWCWHVDTPQAIMVISRTR